MSSRSVHSARTLRTNRSAYACALGERGGVLTTSMPSAASTASNEPVNLASRSRLSNRNFLVRSPRSMTRLRACGVVRAAVGLAVTARMCTLAGGDVHDEQHIQAAQRHRVEV